MKKTILLLALWLPLMAVIGSLSGCDCGLQKYDIVGLDRVTITSPQDYTMLSDTISGSFDLNVWAELMEVATSINYANSSLYGLSCPDEYLQSLADASISLSINHDLHDGTQIIPAGSDISSHQGIHSEVSEYLARYTFSEEIIDIITSSAETSEINIHVTLSSGQNYSIIKRLYWEL